MKVMVLSDRIMGWSSYSHITYETCLGLKMMGHEVAHIPMGSANKMGKTLYEGIMVYESGDDMFSEGVAMRHYLDFHADMLVTIKDPWVFGSVHREALNFVPQVPLDHAPASPSMTDKLHYAFKVIVVSRFAQRELGMAGIRDNVRYIPWGVRTDLFKQMDKAECKKLWFIEPDDFTVLFVGMNRVRKMIPRVCRVYKRFRELNPDVKSHMLLWTRLTPTPPQNIEGALGMGVSDSGVQLMPEILELGLGEAIRWPREEDYLKTLPWSAAEGWDMCKLYNAADVILETTGGEGAGLPLVEAAGCGVPGITTDYAAGPEYVGPGLAVPQSDYVIMNTPGSRYALVDIDKAAEAITKIMNADRVKLARKCRAFAERMDWSKIMDQYWKPFLEDCELELRPRITKDGVRTWA